MGKKKSKLTSQVSKLMFAVFIIAGGFWYLVYSRDIAQFREFCRSIVPGQPSNSLRESALSLSYLFEHDPDSASHPKNIDTFIIRPSSEWPQRFGCHVQVQNGTVIKTRK